MDTRISHLILQSISISVYAKFGQLCTRFTHLIHCVSDGSWRKKNNAIDFLPSTSYTDSIVYTVQRPFSRPRRNPAQVLPGTCLVRVSIRLLTPVRCEEYGTREPATIPINIHSAFSQLTPSLSLLLSLVFKSIRKMTGDIQDPEGLIAHLKELVESYEELVQDMTRALGKSKDELKFLETAGELRECEQCDRMGKVVSNLTAQIDNLTKAKKLTTSLWHSSAEQIERLEVRLKSLSTTTVTKSSPELRPHLLDDQIKLLQAYIGRLESRIEQATAEKNFYRRKLMESKLENQAALKNWAIEKQKEIELVKATYIKEIDHVKGLLEKERGVYQSSMDQRLEDARKFWAAEEKQRRDTLKKNWLAQIEPILLEQERLLVREAQLSEKLYQTQQELIQTKQLLWSGSVQGVFQSSPRLEPPRMKEKPVKDDDDKALSRSCSHHECVNYGMHLRVLQENERLAEEISSLRRSKQNIETDNQANIRRLEGRIRDLESLNHKLQEKLIISTSKSQDNLGPRQDQSIPPAQMTKKKRDVNLKHDPVLNLADEFTQLCSLTLSDQRVDPARVEHLEMYAKELQLRNQLERKSHPT